MASLPYPLFFMKLADAIKNDFSYFFIILLPEEFVHNLVTLLHVRVFLYECVNVNL